jgi:hypothetical protein
MASGAITARVVSVADGPRRSRAVDVVKSFSTEAGIRTAFSRRAYSSAPLFMSRT